MKAIITTSANPLHFGHIHLYEEAVRIFGEKNTKIAIGRNSSKGLEFGRIVYHLTPFKVKYDISQ